MTLVRGHVGPPIYGNVLPHEHLHVHIRVYRPTIISEINMILGGFVMQTHLD